MAFVILFFLGASIGSFISVLTDRIPRGENSIVSRSQCESCGKTLAWYDLIPIFSYVSLKGECRYCKKKIPSRLFFTELFFGFLFAGIFLYSSPLLSITDVLKLFYVLATVSILSGIFLIDLMHGIIPDSLIASSVLASLIFYIIFSPISLVPALVTGIVSFLFFLSLFLLTKGKGMGLGDVKFAFAVGFLLGFPKAVVAFYGAFLTGALVSLILIAWGKKKLRRDTVPFGPFLVVGTGIAALESQFLIRLFFGLR